MGISSLNSKVFSKNLSTTGWQKPGAEAISSINRLSVISQLTGERGSFATSVCFAMVSGQL
ncbi:MAG: hypothetical protein IIC58_13095 [Proteobacteria bacterium]|nr:hypothetical protein [Pseudomonadota bacterium]